MALFLVLIWIHFLADFVMQTNEMAQNKSTSLRWLTIHICVYTTFFVAFGWQFALINGAAHWIVDFFTSKATSYLWKKKEVHYFFVVIGFDQALHLTILFLTTQYILR